MSRSVLVLVMVGLASKWLIAQPPVRLKSDDARGTRFNQHIGAAMKHLRADALNHAEKSLEAAARVANAKEAVMVAVLRSDVLSKRGEFGAANELLRKALKNRTKKNASAFLGAENNLAWLLSVSPTKDVRNGIEAKKLATILYAKYKRHEMLDTLAAAHAECGEFGLAVKLQQQVVDAGGEDPHIDEYKKRLNLYMSGKPFRLPEKMLRDLF